MDSVTLTAPDTNEKITVYVIEETTLNEQKYLLVAENCEEDAEAFILKEIATDDTDAVYEIVEDDVEFEAVVKVFEELVEDTDFEM